MSSGTAQLGLYSAIQAGQYRTEDKFNIRTIQKLRHDTQKANNTKKQKNKNRFSRILRHSVRKRVGLIPQRSLRAHTFSNRERSKVLSFSVAKLQHLKFQRFSTVLDTVDFICSSSSKTVNIPKNDRDVDFSVVDLYAPHKYTQSVRTG